jgi:hypothetical protein
MRLATAEKGAVLTSSSERNPEQYLDTLGAINAATSAFPQKPLELVR